jgi:glutamine synthetase
LSFAFLGFVDVNGSLRGKSYDSAAFEAICEKGFVACTDLLLAVGPRDEAITTLDDIGVRSGSGDLQILPVTETVRELPWRRGSRICLGDVAWRDGSSCGLSSRGVLKRALEQLGEQGLQAMAAFEYEVRLWSATDGTPATGAQSYSVRGVDSVAEFAAALQEAAEVLDLDLIAIHTEGGAGLLEINTGAAPAQKAADSAVLLKYAIHEVARQCGLRASFLAKPIAGEEGSSGHLHVSVWDGERNAMTASGESGGVSPTMTNAVGGVIRHLPAMSLLMNPNINSYKRLVPGFFAPVNASWGIENRSAAVRVVSPDGEHARVEVRRPGADANPYLALAAVVAPLAEGLRLEVAPPEEYVGDAYAAGHEECPPLPSSLESAIGAFAADRRAQELLGETFSDYYLKTRAWELHSWQESVTEWERERYGEVT